MIGPKLSWAYVIFLLVLLTGCTQQVAPSDPPLESKVAMFAQTATARSYGKQDVDGAVSAAQAQATQLSQSMQATRSMQVLAHDQSAQATATAVAPMVAELPVYGIDLNKGHPGWLHQPVTITVDGFRQGDYANDFSMISVKDFVMAADISWNTEYGASGCGFVLRSNGEKDAADGYIVMLSRSANGHAYFTAMADGKPANYRNFYANRTDPAFAWENGSLNRLAVVGQGPILSIYTNYTLVGAVDTSDPPPPHPELPDPPFKPEKPRNELTQLAQQVYQAELEKYSQKLKEYNQTVTEIKEQHAAVLKSWGTRDTVYSEGFVSMFAFAYSGYVECSYTDVWLWQVGE